MLLPDYDEYMAQREAASNLIYEVKMLSLLYKHLHSTEEFADDRRDAGDEFGFAWYNEQYNLAIKLYGSKLKDVAPIELLRSEGMTKTKVWREYFDCKANHSKDALVGLVFPIRAMTQFVIHNYLQIPAKVGVNKIVRRGSGGDRSGLVVEPFKAFCEELEMWSTR